MNQFKVGDVKITRIIESEAPWRGTWLFPDATAENVQKEADWLYPTFSDEKGKLRMSIHALIIESQGKRIIVDTCIGNDKVRSNPVWSNLKLPFLRNPLGLANRLLLTTNLRLDQERTSLDVADNYTDTYSATITADYSISQNFKYTIGGGYSDIVHQSDFSELDVMTYTLTTALTIQF